MQPRIADGIANGPMPQNMSPARTRQPAANHIDHRVRGSVRDTTVNTTPIHQSNSYTQQSYWRSPLCSSSPSPPKPSSPSHNVQMTSVVLKELAIRECSICSRTASTIRVSSRSCTCKPTKVWVVSDNNCGCYLKPGVPVHFSKVEAEFCTALIHLPATNTSNVTDTNATVRHRMAFLGLTVAICSLTSTFKSPSPAMTSIGNVRNSVSIIPT